MKSTDNEKMRQTLAENLEFIIRQSGYTQAQVADATGISRSAMSSYCNGVRYPRPSQLKALAEFFKVGIGRLTDDLRESGMGQSEMSNEAYWIAQSFDELDSYGRELVRIVVENELRRLDSQKREKDHADTLK